MTEREDVPKTVDEKLAEFNAAAQKATDAMAAELERFVHAVNDAFGVPRRRSWRFWRRSR